MNTNRELKLICEKFFKENQKTYEEQNKIYECILYYITTAPHLSALYRNWSDLEELERYALNNIMQLSTTSVGKIMYSPIIRAFAYWDYLQDVYVAGAPGFSGNPLTETLSEHTDKEIIQVLRALEKTVDHIQSKRKTLQELNRAHEDPKTILYNYKWRIKTKKTNRKRSSFTLNTYNDDKSDDDISFLDLNGRGDNKWFSDI